MCTHPGLRPMCPQSGTLLQLFWVTVKRYWDNRHRFKMFATDILVTSTDGHVTAVCVLDCFPYNFSFISIRVSPLRQTGCAVDTFARILTGSLGWWRQVLGKHGTCLKLQGRMFCRYGGPGASWIANTPCWNNRGREYTLGTCNS